ncbi:MAG: TIGR02186 family protein [Hyphomicrobiales bacterium]
MMRALLFGFMMVLGTATAQAEDLIVTLSERTVEITSNFTGSAITLFGAVRRDASTVPRASDYDVVVTVTGPPTDRVTRLKDRVFGVWINRHAREFDDVPSAYSVLSNRPVEEIAHPSLLTRLGIGINYVLPQATPDLDTENNPEAVGLEDASSEIIDEVHLSGRPSDHVFERAFLRLQRESRQYQEDVGAVSIIDNTLFRARATFPADVPLGTFEVRVFLFSGGVLLSQEEVGIVVRKAGFEQFIYRLSQTDPLIYGVLAVLLALLTGWLGGVVFRRS